MGQIGVGRGYIRDKKVVIWEMGKWEGVNFVINLFIFETLLMVS